MKKRKELIGGMTYEELEDHYLEGEGRFSPNPPVHNFKMPLPDYVEEEDV